MACLLGNQAENVAHLLGNQAGNVACLLGNQAENVAHLLGNQAGNVTCLLGNQAENVAHLLGSIHCVLRDKLKSSPQRGWDQTSNVMFEYFVERLVVCECALVPSTSPHWYQVHMMFEIIICTMF